MMKSASQNSFDLESGDLCCVDNGSTTSTRTSGRRGRSTLTKVFYACLAAALLLASIGAIAVSRTGTGASVAAPEIDASWGTLDDTLQGAQSRQLRRAGPLTLEDGRVLSASLGGAESCCSPELLANPTQKFKWSAWPAAAMHMAEESEVVIPCGTEVELDMSPAAPLAGLRIEGRLTVADNGDHIEVNTAYVYTCGELVADLRSGNTQLDFTLIGHIPLTVDGRSYSTKAFVTYGGLVDLRGGMCNRTTWQLLDKSADAGTTQLHLDGPVEWPVGTELMVASTDYSGAQTEIATVAAVTNHGQTVELTAPLYYPHAGVAPITAEVAALSRNIKITSEASCARIPNAEADNKAMCGHFVIDHTPRGIVCGVEITNMGKHTTTGKYPLHTHMCGDAPEIQIRSNAVHSNHHRAIVIHATSNATWVENVLYRTQGHLMLTEDAAEEGNMIKRNIFSMPMKPSPAWSCEDVVPSPYGSCEQHRCSHGTGIYEMACGNRHDDATNGVWISNPANHFIENRAVTGLGTDTAFRIETRGLTGAATLLPANQQALFATGAFRKSQGIKEGKGSFVGNVAHSSNRAFRNYPFWTPKGGIVIKDLQAWKCSTGVIGKVGYGYNNPNLAGSEKYSLLNATLLANRVQVMTIHDASHLHVEKSFISPWIPAGSPAAQDPIAVGGACVSEAANVCGFSGFEWRDAVEGADGTAEKPFGDWYKAGTSSLASGRRVSCMEPLLAGTIKNGVVDTTSGYVFPVNRHDQTKCAGATGADKSYVKRASVIAVSSDVHKYSLGKAFFEGKHHIEPLTWSMTADEETLATARKNGYGTMEETFGLYGPQGGPVGPILGQQAHMGIINKGYIHYGIRKRFREQVIFPTVEEVERKEAEMLAGACSDGAWELVFRQTDGFAFDSNDDWAQAKRYNAEDADADQYSILDDLESYRSKADGKIELKLVHPEVAQLFADVHSGPKGTFVWKQSSNPLTYCPGGARSGCGVDGFESVFPDFQNRQAKNRWGGLERSSGNRDGFLDGSANHAYKGYAIAHGSAGANSRFAQKYQEKYNLDAPQKVELYACRSEAEAPPAPVTPAPVSYPPRAEAGEWQLVFRQTFKGPIPFIFSSDDDWAQGKSYNAEDSSADNFSILGELESFRSSQDGKLEFKLAYPEDSRKKCGACPEACTTCRDGGGSDDPANKASQFGAPVNPETNTCELYCSEAGFCGRDERRYSWNGRIGQTCRLCGPEGQKAQYCSKENHWKQTSNPVTTKAAGVDGFEPISLGFPEKFLGMEYRGNGAMLKCAAGSARSTPHYSVASNYVASNFKGFYAQPGHTTQKVELYVRVPGGFVATEAPTASPTAAPTTAAPTAQPTVAPTAEEIVESEDVDDTDDFLSEDTEDIEDMYSEEDGEDTEAPAEASWHLVFRQTYPFKFSKADDWAQAKSYNAEDDTADNFSILGDLEDFRSPEDDKFQLKLAYPGSRAFGRGANVWKQTTNPVTATKGGVEGYESISTPWTNYGWQGLEKSGNRAFLDGSVNRRWWFYAIGSARHWKGGYPSAKGSAQKVELYAYF